MSTQVQIGKVDNDIDLGIYRGINTYRFKFDWQGY